MKHKDDGKFVVVQGGQRISDLQPNEQAAIQEANRVRKLQETKDKTENKRPPVEVKQNLYGAITVLAVPVFTALAAAFTSLC